MIQGKKIENFYPLLYSVTFDFPSSRSCIFFTHFCFELDFGINMKVLAKCVSFPMILV